MRLYLNIGLNTMYQVLARVVTAVVGLVAIRLITSSLGVTGFGDYQIVITYVTLFWILTDFGLNAIAVREMAAHEDELPENFSALITLRGAMGIGLVAIASIILIFLDYEPQVKTAILIGSFSIFFQALLGSANGLFQVKLRYDQQLISNTAGSIISLLLVVLSAQRGWGLYGFVVAFASASLVMALANIALAHRWVAFKISTDLTRLKYLFKETLPFGTALLFSLATFKVDALMLSMMNLGGMPNNQAVGIYNLAYKVFELVLIVPVFFMNPVYPVLVRHLDHSLEQFKSSILKAEAALFIASVGVIVVLLPLAPWVIRLLADTPGFEDSVGLLRLLAVWSPFFFSTALLMWILVTLKRQTELIVVYASGFFFNLITNWIFIPRYQYWGAAVTTGVTEGIVLVLLLIFVYKSWGELKSSKRINNLQ